MLANKGNLNFTDYQGSFQYVSFFKKKRTQAIYISKPSMILFIVIIEV